jgi:hypothetical protein
MGKQFVESGRSLLLRFWLASVVCRVLDDCQDPRGYEPRRADHSARSGQLADLDRRAGAAHFHGATSLGRLDRVLARGAASGIDKDFDEIAFCHASSMPKSGRFHALQSVMGAAFRVSKQRGDVLSSPFAIPVVATVRPSSILRAVDDAPGRLRRPPSSTT